MLLLVLSGQETKVFLIDRGTLQPLPFNMPRSIYDDVPDGPERVGDFSDITEQITDRCRQFSAPYKELDNLILEHHLPVLLLGAGRIPGH